MIGAVSRADLERLAWFEVWATGLFVEGIMSDADSDNFDPQRGKGGEPPRPSDEELWTHDRNLIRRFRDGNDQTALQQLYEEKLRPILDRSRGACPNRLANRSYEEACKALSGLVDSGAPAPDRPDRKEWEVSVQRILHDLAAKLRSADEDWLLVILAREGSVSAEDQLLHKYEVNVHQVAFDFLGRCPEILDDLSQEGLVSFRDKVVPKYNPEQGTTLWEFARTIVWRKMRDVCHRWTRGREIGSTGAAVSLEQKREHSDAQPTEPEDPEADVSERELRRGQFDIIVHYLNQHGTRGSNGVEGMRWVVAFALKYAGYTWDDTVAILRGEAECDWATIHDSYPLPDSIPTDIGQVRLLFTSGGPWLSVANLRKWYGKRCKDLAEGLDENLEERSEDES